MIEWLQQHGRPADSGPSEPRPVILCTRSKLAPSRYLNDVCSICFLVPTGSKFFNKLPAHSIQKLADHDLLQIRNRKQVCGKILLGEKAYNVEHHILPSAIAIVNRMLSNSVGLEEAYNELHTKLNDRPGALHAVLSVVLRTAAHWSPQDIEAARAARNDLDDVNCQIAQKAADLADLLRQRMDLSNTSGFSSGTYFHICDVIDDVSQENSWFLTFLWEPLNALRCQFDMKYWPSIGSLVAALASDAADASSRAQDPLIAVSTESRRSSLADFVKALLAAINQESAHHYGPIPGDFHVTDKTTAALVNCSLDLASDSLVDSAYVKRLRQRVRDSAK